MNKDYIYVNGQVVISDENGMKAPVEYSDNIDDILLVENLIEFMKAKLSEEQKRLEKKQASAKNYKKNLLWDFIYFCVTPLVAPALICKFIGIETVAIVETGVFAGMSFTAMMTASFAACIVGLIGIPSYLRARSDHKGTLKQVKGIENEISFLSKQLVEEKDRLVELQNTQTKEIEQEFASNMPRKVNDKQMLENLRSQILLYYWAGVKEKKYFKWQQKGILREKLASQYTEVGLGLIEEYLKDIAQAPVEEKGQARSLKPRK